MLTERFGMMQNSSSYKHDGSSSRSTISTHACGSVAQITPIPLLSHGFSSLCFVWTRMTRHVVAPHVPGVKLVQGAEPRNHERAKQDTCCTHVSQYVTVTTALASKSPWCSMKRQQAGKNTMPLLLCSSRVSERITQEKASWEVRTLHGVVESGEAARKPKAEEIRVCIGLTQNQVVCPC